MRIIAHRGFWQEPGERNSRDAFRRAFQSGFGVEIDFRDCQGRLVVSHNIPTDQYWSADQFFELCSRLQPVGPIAINIKADGLQELIIASVKHAGLKDYFVFDMSVPDAIGYLNASIPTFTRWSKYETVPSFIERASGVWVDCFDEDFGDFQLVKQLLAGHKRVCFVSPELHDRDEIAFWQRLKDQRIHSHVDIMLCTDRPERARGFFND